MDEITETKNIDGKNKSDGDKGWTGAGSPYEFFKSTTHELVAQDAAFQLIKPGMTFDEALAKSNITDYSDLVRFATCRAKLEECELGESTPEQYRSGINLVITILRGLPAIKGRARAEFMQGLSRLFAPGYYELLETGKMSGDGKTQKQGGIFRKKEKKAAQEEEF